MMAWKMYETFKVLLIFAYIYLFFPGKYTHYTNTSDTTLVHTAQHQH